jgi:glucuronate isomerase
MRRVLRVQFGVMNMNRITQASSSNSGLTIPENRSSKEIGELLRHVSLTSELSPRAFSLFERLKDLPVIDLHTHYDVGQIVKDAPWKTPVDVFLGRPAKVLLPGEQNYGFDHYVAQLMLKYNTPEDIVYGTKDRSIENEKERFFHAHRALKLAYGSDRYLWFRTALSEVFGIPMSPFRNTAEDIWNAVSEKLSSGAFTPKSVLANGQVKVALTTDDPTSDLSQHSLSDTIKLIPTWRPDNALMLKKEGRYDFSAWLRKLESSAGVPTISGLDSFINALRNRMEYFVAHGCIASDIGFPNYYETTITASSADSLFRRYVRGGTLTDQEQRDWQGFMLKELLKLNAEFGLRQYLHQGPARDTNSTLFNQFGPDIGGDGQGEKLNISGFRAIFNELASLPHPHIPGENMVAPTIVFPINSSDFDWTIINSTPFCGRGVGEFPKIMLGPPWWWNDSREGIRQMIRRVIDTDGISSWIGMLSDARSLTSVYPRFMMFRALLSIELAENGMMKSLSDDELFSIGEKVCYLNARDWLGLREQQK